MKPCKIYLHFTTGFCLSVAARNIPSVLISTAVIKIRLFPVTDSERCLLRSLQHVSAGVISVAPYWLLLSQYFVTAYFYLSGSLLLTVVTISRYCYCYLSGSLLLAVVTTSGSCLLLSQWLLIAHCCRNISFLLISISVAPYCLLLSQYLVPAYCYLSGSLLLTIVTTSRYCLLLSQWLLIGYCCHNSSLLLTINTTVQ
jgi:hypothetical protein